MPTTIVTEYASYLQDEKGMAEPTRRGYLAAVESLLAVARAHPRRLYLPAAWGVEHLDKRALEIYLNHLREERGLAASTVAQQASALRAFFDFLQRRGYVERNPARRLLPKLPPRDETPPDGDVEAVRELFARAPGRLAEAREQLLLELCYGAALRPAVMWRIRSVQVLSRAGLLRIVTPQEQLEAPLSREGLERAKRYLALRKEVAAGRRQVPFWLDERGRACTPTRLGRQIKRAMERVGLEGGPTVLRQLAARHFAERGGDTRSVQQLLHAKRLGSLDRYAPPDFQSVLRQFRRIHPRQQPLE
ncbi:MAG TPA: site-specific integrase [bacterium]|nr:site-specific integrase [bacterium]